MSKLKRLKRLSVAIILLMCCSLDAQDDPTNTVSYEPTSENFPNPERGFYHQDAPMWFEEELIPQDAAALRAMRNEGITMVRWYFLIDEFRDAPLDEEALDYIDSQFNAARDAGIKVIPRFAYNFPTGGEYPFTEPDAPLELVIEHINQLIPLLEKHADVIAFMELGFVGAWGEWHSSTHNLVNHETGVNENSRAIVEHLLAALPSERMVAMRYAPYKQQLYGDSPLELADAFSGSPQARMGAHNDCFLASVTDWGTYPEDASEREALRTYLNLDNRYVPQGGETCNPDAQAQPFIGCENAIADLALLRFSALNIDYHPDVLEGWRDEGCFDEIALRMGYRFRLLEATASTVASLGGGFYLSFTLVNDGWASPYNPRGLEVVLRSQADGTQYHLALEEEFDPRLWLPEFGEITVEVTAGLPDDMPPGTYEVLLYLPDTQPDLYIRPEYAIRLANEGLWEVETGLNHLQMVVNIGGTGEAFDGEFWFERWESRLSIQ